MKICVGFKNYENLNRYIDAGADEFYCGVIEESWVSKYGHIIGINRRPWPSANLKDFKELKYSVDKAHKNKCKVYFTINEHCYTQDQLKAIDHHVNKALECEVDSLIFSDPGLIKFFYDKYKCNIHLSTGGTVFNKYTAKFFRDELKVTRIIMPREVTISEIKNIVKVESDLEYEIFMLNEGCINIDGFCNHIHGISYISREGELQNQFYSSGCLLKYKVVQSTLKTRNKYKEKELSQKLFEAVTRSGNCGVCALYFFKDIKIDSLKLVGRATNESKIVNDIKFLKNAILRSKQVNNFQDFYEEIAECKCKGNDVNQINNCYYPEILKYTEK